VKVSLVFFGVLLALFNLAAFAIARWNKQIVDALGYTALLVGTLACLAISLALLGFTRSPLLIGLAIALLGAAAGAARPVTQAGLTVVPPESRQQVNARMEQITGAANAGVLALGGLLLQHGEVTVLMPVAALVVIGCGVTLLLAARRSPNTQN
jgi:predicted MFS family arabinose efflux permease